MIQIVVHLGKNCICVHTCTCKQSSVQYVFFCDCAANVLMHVVLCMCMLVSVSCTYLWESIP